MKMGIIKKHINNHPFLLQHKLKIKRFIRQTYTIYYDLCFDLEAAISIYLVEVLFPFEKKYNSSFRLKIALYRIKVVKKYLYTHYGEIVNKYREKKAEKEESLSLESPIWIMWWQGKENAPVIVLKCIESINKHSCGHPVILLNKDNYEFYVDIPKWMVNKIDKEITITHFSDILRVKLLRKWGGVWMDATIFLSNDISNDIFSGQFYSRKAFGGIGSPSQFRWSGFFMSGSANNILFCFIDDLFTAYWGKEHRIIDYFLLDYIIAIGYDSIPVVKNIIDSVPYNNSKIEDMVLLLNKVFVELDYNDLIQDTDLHKLNCKQEFIESIHGQKSYYGYIINSLNN